MSKTIPENLPVAEIDWHQAGIASMIVTFIMMMVISLIVLGFSEVTRRNSREALDRQLSSQAFYAAETGINDALHAYRPGSLTASDATNCKAFMGAPRNLPNVLDQPTGSVAYTCLLISDDLPNILDSIEQGASKVENIHMSRASRTLNFKWGTSGGGTNTSCPTPIEISNNSSSGVFKPESLFNGGGCEYALLRVDLLPAPAGGVIDPLNLIQTTKSFYLMPSNTNMPLSGPDFAGLTNNRVYAADCSAAQQCTVPITGLSGKDFYARLSTIYNRADIQIDSPGTTFPGSQLQIDSTGKAQDELKRLLIRVSLNSTGTIPANALSSSDSICKRFITFGAPTDYASPNYNAPTNSGAGTGPLCGP